MFYCSLKSTIKLGKSSAKIFQDHFTYKKIGTHFNFSAWATNVTFNTTHQPVHTHHTKFVDQF